MSDAIPSKDVSVSLRVQDDPELFVFGSPEATKVVQDALWGRGLTDGRIAVANLPSKTETLAQRVATQVVQNVCELPDYTSPDDQPDLVMCTVQELESCVLRAFESAGAERLDVELATEKALRAQNVRDVGLLADRLRELWHSRQESIPVGPELRASIKEMLTSPVETAAEQVIDLDAAEWVSIKAAILSAPRFQGMFNAGGCLTDACHDVRAWLAEGESPVNGPRGETPCDDLLQHLIRKARAWRAVVDPWNGHPKVLELCAAIDALYSPENGPAPPPPCTCKTCDEIENCSKRCDEDMRTDTRTRCVCGEQDWPPDATQIEDSRGVLHFANRPCHHK